ncbi:transmembrane protein 18 [Plakobranchus ocellatus]|uniref:Transmembrane protein 18 n=1 Tax=Plakobranchus ocellatus TaxID=259542 RepID=A0AAV4A4N8_9GAST|nr:transmembrane protein 18 [Plakobranchus ocellatus]
MDPINTTQITGLWTYLETVDWSDPWFSGLLAFHLVMFAITFLTRNHQMFQAVHFVILLMLVYSAESINELAAQYWSSFSKQQYFDSKGLFISVVWSTPLLINTLIIVMSWILTSSQLMVSAGRLKIEMEKRKQNAVERKNEKEKSAKRKAE